MFKLGKFKLVGWVIVGIFICWLCFYLPSLDRGQQYKVINNFYTELFRYDGTKGENLESYEDILKAIQPYLAKETRIDQETISSLVVQPATRSKVKLSFETLDAFEQKGEYVIDGKRLYQFDVTLSVVSKGLDEEKAKATTLNMYVQLVKETGGWKVHSMEYFANDLLYEN